MCNAMHKITIATSTLISSLGPQSYQNHNIKIQTSPPSLVPECNTLDNVKQIHAYSIKTNLQRNYVILEKLIKSYVLCSSMHYAQQLFDQITEPDIILFNLMARGYANSDTPHEAIALLNKVLLTFNIFPDYYTFPSLLKACAKAEALEEGKQIHCLAIKYGMSDNMYVYPTLINMYIGCDVIESARKVFDMVSEPCIVTYNSMINGYVKNSMTNEGLALFCELQERKVEPTFVTILGVISLCALLGALDMGKWIHEYARKRGFHCHIKVNTALIDMYAKCGSLSDAISIFESMDSKDTQVWSTMIMAYAVHGQGHDAISLFEEMIKDDVKPDGVTFLGLLYGCNHAGLVEEGFGFFHRMVNCFKIAPDIKHYGCLLDLLGRAGRLNDAYKFLEELPVKATPTLWRTLLAACGNHGNVELGKKVIEKIFELDKSHNGDYVIFSNMCARSGRWVEVNNIRKLMKERGVVKVPGCSSVEVNNEVHEFFSGDGTQVEYKELHESVDNLVENLKLVGYVPDTSLVFHRGMDEKEKETTLRYHSEKLAITFGILNTSPGEVIRVVKNLRVCNDCHSAAKFISSVCNRQIILRDVQRFHHFKDGKCSCGDYW